MASETPAQPTQRSGPVDFTTLPRELQKEIVGHCSQADLICLSLVSKHFQELAAAELYRNFHIVFPDEDDPAYDSPVDGLAGGLETFVTSDYDYAKHLRDISLDTLSAGEKAEQAYKPYLYNVSCGKFMNTLLLLTLRKAKTLEKFRWNIRVELSRPVYKALHQIETLDHLHIRLQLGPSLYEPPPPLPLYSPSTSPSGSTHHLPILDPPPPQPVFSLSPPPPPPPFYIPTPTSSLPSSLPPPKASKARGWKKSISSTSPPTLSGFKGLKTLSVLDIDDLEAITELKSCIRNSQGSLNKLKLSFSTSLASRARKPPPDSDPDDSDVDDEFQVLPTTAPTLPSYDDASGSAKAFRAQEERKTQEAILGRIFDVEPYLVKKPAKRTRDKENETPKQDQTSNPGQDFINSLKTVSGKLMTELSGSEDLTAAQQDILDTIVAAAKKYVSEEESKAESSKENEKSGESAISGANGEATVEVGVTNGQQAEPSLFEQKTSKGKETQQDSNPDDIDIEAPVEDNFVEEASEAGAPEAINGSETAELAETTASSQSPAKTNGTVVENGGITSQKVSTSVSRATVNLDAQRDNFKMLTEKLESFELKAEQLQREINELPVNSGPDAMKQVEDAERQTQEFSGDIKEIRQEMSAVAAEIEDAEKQIPAGAKTDEPDAVRQSISEYTRSTRGLSLQTLSIHLIPVKASVLSRAIDLRILKRITLLNVGNQAPIWALLSKENKAAPLAVRKIFTDNVSTVFLTFLSQLAELHELFMLERPEKYKPESFAPKTTVTIEQIRRLALRKHMPALKRLMIKNQNDSSWDVDMKTTSLICGRGKVIEELAVSMSIREIHTMLQQMQLLTNLRALHIINLRNDDTCVWVMRETKRFVIDTLSHFPEMKIEWLAIDEAEHVERIVRWKELPKEKKNKAKKGKEKASSALTNGDHQYPMLSMGNTDIGSDSDDDYENGGEEGTSRILTIENIHFYDVWGVHIFKREVITGRL